MGHRADFSADFSANFIGATLIYGPEAPRPDLILAGQFLIDDMRRGGQHPGALRINSRSLRLRMEGMDLALAITGGPLPPEALMDLMRPVLPAPAAAPGPFTDITHLRVQTALRRHVLALGVLLRRRHRSSSEPGFPEEEDEEDLSLTAPGQPKAPPEPRRGARPLRGAARPGPAGLPELARTDTLWHTLHPAILAVSEAAPPGLVIWQPTGVVYSAAEFSVASLERLAEQGDPGVTLRPLAIRRPASRPRELVAPKITSREDRAASRSAGRLFRPNETEGEADAAQPERPMPPLPRLEAEAQQLQSAMRGEAQARHGLARRLLARVGLGGLAVVLLLWLLWPAPPGPGSPHVLAVSHAEAGPAAPTPAENSP